MDDGARWTVAIIAVAVVVLGAVVFVGSKNGSGSSAGGVNADAAILAVRANDHSRGSASAKATLIEYGDFQCPACGQYEPMLEQLVAEHGAEVNFIFRNFPLPQHNNAELMARAAEAADKQGKYWQLHDRIYKEQASWENSTKAKELVEGYAKDAGLDVGKFDTDLFDQSVTDRITNDKKDASTLNLPGTPSFFLNGKVLTNPKSYDALVKAVQDAGK